MRNDHIHPVVESQMPSTALPESVNWITAGAMNPIDRQGSCGSCWAFATTSSIEAAHFIETGELVKLSEQ